MRNKNLVWQELYLIYAFTNKCFFAHIYHGYYRRRGFFKIICCSKNGISIVKPVENTTLEVFRRAQYNEKSFANHEKRWQNNGSQVQF